LSGTTVLDLSMFAAAPGGPGLLADLGARVIKIEPPSGDPLGANVLGGNELFFRVNRGKERITLDLKSSEGQAILHRLVAQADVVVHNFRPGVPARLGADFATLSAVNDRLVYVYAASFGSTGPDAHRPAFDAVISAMAGGEVLQAGEGNPPQQRQTTDHSALLGVAVAVLLGLRARRATGRAQNIETTMLASAAYLLSDDFLRYPGKPPRPKPDAGQHGLHALYRLYRAADGWVFLAAPQQDEWEHLAAALGVPELEDAALQTPEGRRSRDAELAGVLERIFSGRTGDDWEALLLPLDVACVKVAQAWTDVLLDGRFGDQPQLTTEYELEGAGHVVQSGAAVVLSETPGSLGAPRPAGGSTRAVLAELGYADAEIDDLVARGIVVAA
jgi:crotonobetainyl-CoA:carnitine CoA-transferase CaiB-like acyl-CoA transferase